MFVQGLQEGCLPRSPAAGFVPGPWTVHPPTAGVIFAQIPPSPYALEKSEEPSKIITWKVMPVLSRVSRSS